LPELESLGWNDRLSTVYEPYAGDDVVPGRVSIQHRGAYDVLTQVGELRCEVPRRLVHEAVTNADLPVVGDWVVIAPGADAGSAVGTIRAVLPRFTKFSRKTAWQAAEEQVLAANIDVVFVVTSLNEDLNLRRLERYLILARESGAQPVVLLTKSDLAADSAAALAAIGSIAADVPVHALSNVTGEGLDAVRGYLHAGVTAALLGSSGVGKSTLVNTLLGEELLATQELRGDGQGRHTTTRRELVQLPGGALVIDTPGMRELQLWVADEGLEETFDDVTSLFAHCRFADCQHDSEPGCAVLAAVEEGTLSADRLERWRALEREAIAADRRADPHAQKVWGRSFSRVAKEAQRRKGRS
jgi:ribosome biogenesis GTPase / thiamine phosphate phosphatase